MYIYNSFVYDLFCNFWYNVSSVILCIIGFILNGMVFLYFFYSSLQKSSVSGSVNSVRGYGLSWLEKQFFLNSVLNSNLLSWQQLFWNQLRKIQLAEFFLNWVSLGCYDNLESMKILLLTNQRNLAFCDDTCTIDCSPNLHYDLWSC